MFSYSTDNAEFFSKKVEFLKRSYYYRLWLKQSRKSQETKMPLANHEQLQQRSADEGVVLDDEDYPNMEFQHQPSQYSQQQQQHLGLQRMQSQQSTFNQQYANNDNIVIQDQTNETQQILQSNNQTVDNQINNNKPENLIIQQEDSKAILDDNLKAQQQQEQEQKPKNKGKKEEEEEEDEDDKDKKKKEKPVNLKFGDIIYLKYYVQSRKKGVISGDGIASNKLELIPQSQDISIIKELVLQQHNQEKGNNYFGNNGKLVFRKCLFQVQNSKKYTYMQQLNEHRHIIKDLKDKKELRNLNHKSKNEQEENLRVFERVKGVNVIYGQEIQLKHIYSSCTLTLNPKILAKANCCREMSLEEKDNEWSNFRIISINNAKKMGEPVLYSDYISMVSAKDKHQCLNVDEFGDHLEMGLEVNAFESPDPFKICNYLDFQSYDERESFDFKGKIVQSGDIITLMNRDTGGNLGVKLTKTFEQNISQRNIFFEFENRERISMRQPYYDHHQAFQETVNSNVLYIDKHQESEDELNIMVFWEVQKAEGFDSAIPGFKRPFRLKNVATGLYLMIDNEQLILTKDGQSDSCLFFFDTKKSIKQSSENIHYNTRIKLLSYVGSKQIMCLDKEAIHEKKHFSRSENVNEIEAFDKDTIEKNKASKCIFEITPSTKDMSLMADQVSSLLPYLLKFYMLLQEWGIDKQGIHLASSHKKAFEEQKQLYNAVLQLNQSLENLSYFLSGKDDFVLHFRQNVLYRNGVLSLLISILQLIHFSIYGSRESADPRSQPQWQKLYNSQEISHKSAQKIAFLKMKSIVPTIYKIIILMIKGNPDCSSYILQTSTDRNAHENFLEFFLDQYRYHKSHVQVLLREAVRFSNLNDGIEGMETEGDDNISKWTSKLESVTMDNIEEQSFIIELLGLTITDSLERPIKSSQTKCRKLLFKEEKQDSSIFKNALISFSLKTEYLPQYQDYKKVPVVHFHYDTNKFQNHMDWRMKNLEICQLYKGDAARQKFIQFDKEEQDRQQKSRMFQMSYINGFVEQTLHTISGEGFLAKYEEYVLNCLQLYYYLCKGRNLKSMKDIQAKNKVGLRTDFISHVLEEMDEEHLKYYKCFLNLYQSLILDIEPFAKISEYDNKCFIYDWIKNFDYTEHPYKLFREITFSKKKKAEIQNQIATQKIKGITHEDLENLSELELVSKYADLMFEQEREQYGESQKLFEIYTQKGYKDPSHIRLPEKFDLDLLKAHHTSKNQIDLEKATYIQLEAFLAILKLLKIRIDLGHNNLEENTKIYHATSNIFLGLIYYQMEEENSGQNMSSKSQFEEFNKNWIFVFIKNACKKIYNDEKYNLILTKVFVAAIDIYSILLRLKEHLQVVIYFKHQIIDHERLVEKKKLASKKQRKKKKKPQQQVIDIDANELDELNSPLLRQKSNISETKSFFSLNNNNQEGQDTDSDDSELEELENKKQDAQQQLRNQKMKKYKAQIETWRKIFDIYGEDMILKDPFEQNNQKINIITLIYKSLEVCEQKSKLKEVMQSHMIRLFKYAKEVSEVMNQVEIIEDNYELHLFKLVNGSKTLPDQETDPKSAKDWKYMSDKTVKFIHLVMQMKDIDRHGEMDFVRMESSFHDSRSLISRREYSGFPSSRQQSSYEEDFEVDNIVEKRQKSKVFQNLKDVYENCKECLKTLIYFFEMSDYDKQEETPIRSAEDYQLQLQNILRSSGIYRYILAFLDQDIYAHSYFLEFYRLVIEFLYLFCKGNVRNKQLVLPYFDQIAQLAMLPCQNDVENIANRKLLRQDDIRPLKIQTICTELLKEIKLDHEICSNYINLLFQKIRENEPFSTPDTNPPMPSSPSQRQKNNKQADLQELLDQVRKKLKYPNPDLLKSQAVIQWMRVLKSLCFRENNCNLKENQQKILNSILRTPQLVEIITPIRPEYIKIFNQKFDSTNDWKVHKSFDQKKREFVIRENEYCKIKLHVVGLSLLTTAFKNYLQGIQEVQRFIMFESLKNVLCNQFAPFMIKRAYIRTLFEAYINKVEDPTNENNFTDTVESDDISGILSGEIIPQLDTKNIYVYLEGLVKIPKSDVSIAKDQWNIRKQIIVEKIRYFKKNKEFEAMCNKDAFMLDQGDNNYMDKKYVGILKDPREFWKYLMDEGVMHFLTDTYDEKIKDIESENQKDNILADEFSIIKTNMMKLRQLFDILERDFRVTKNNLHLDQYRELMNQIEDIIPKRKIIKFGKNYRIGIDEHKKVNVETYDTIAEDMVGQGFQDIDEQGKQQNPMKKYLRIFFMRNRIPSSVFKDLLLAERNQKNVRRIAKGVFNVLNKDKVYLDHIEITKFLHYECGINQLPKKVLDKRQDWTDFKDENVEKVIYIITQFFKKAKGPKEIMDGQNDQQLQQTEQQMLEQLQNEAKTMLSVEKIQDEFFKLIFALVKIDYHILNNLHTEDSDFLNNKEDFIDMNPFQLTDEVKTANIVKKLYKAGIKQSFRKRNTRQEVEEDRIIIDTQIMQILRDYITDFDIHNVKKIEYFTHFIMRGSRIFKNKMIYKIKLVRLFLQHIKLNEIDLENLKDDDNLVIKEKAEKKKQDYIQFQNKVIKSKLYLQALRLLDEKADFEIKFESLTLLNEILFMGNEFSQKEIYECLRNDSELQLQFFTFLRSFFLINRYQELKKIKKLKSQNPDADKTEFEILSLKILELLRLLCENVNSEFQNFLRTQVEDGQKGASTNVILEVSNFLTYFLEDTQLDIYQKQEIIIQCFETLTDLVTGEIKNQQILCQNKRLFSFLNDKIIMPRHDFAEHSPEEKEKEIDLRIKNQSNDIKMFHSAIYFLLIVINANKNQESVLNVLEQIDTFQLLINMKQIFEQRIYPHHNHLKLKKLELELRCDHMSSDAAAQNNCQCTEQYCVLGYITKEDIIVVQTGFNIFIFFSYMHDMFPQEPKLKQFSSLIDEQNEVFDADEDDDDDDDDDDDEEEVEAIQEKKDQNKDNKNKEQTQKCCFCFKRNKKDKNAGNEQQKKFNRTIMEKKRKEDKRRRKILQGDLLGLNEEALQEMEEQKKFTIKDKQSQSISKGNIIGLLARDMVEKQLQDAQEEELLDKSEQKKIQIQKEKDKIFFQNLCKFTGHRQKKFFKFYKKYRGVIEVLYVNGKEENKKETVQRVYFQKPFVSNYLTDFIKRHLIEECSRESDQERVEFLRENYKFYFLQMNWKQEISKDWLLHVFANNWRLLKVISFYMVVVMTLIYLFTFDSIQENNNNLQWVTTLNDIVAYCQVIIALIVVFCCAIEKLPISLYKGQIDNSLRYILAIKEHSGFNDKITQNAVEGSQWFIQQFNIDKVKKSKTLQGVMMVLDFDNIYNFVYLVLACAAFYFPYVYAVLLLDIVKQSPDLQNIIKSITQNLTSILKFACLGIVIMTLYGIILYTEFGPENNKALSPDGELEGDCFARKVTFCSDFIMTLTTCFNVGMTAGGGIGDGLHVADYYTDKDNDHYWKRYVFDLSWFILIQLLFVQIIFGIIVDSFSELRQKRNELLTDIENKCFICGLSKTFIDESIEKGWNYHIYMEHNVYHMLFYMIYVMKKNKTECDALEKQVKKQLESKPGQSLEFVPIRRAANIEDGNLIDDEE